MFGFGKRMSRDAQLMQIFNADLAIIEYDPTGRILNVNDIFCKILGYVREEMLGKHQSMFVDANYARSPEYREFWAKLLRGESISQEVKRTAKNGRDIWIEANYRPVVDGAGKVTRIVNYLTDLTTQKTQSADFEAIVKAISRAQAVVEFTPAGEIVTPTRISSGRSAIASTRSRGAIIACSSSPLLRRLRNTKRCGKRSNAASLWLTSSGASARAARFCCCKPRTIPCSTSTAGWRR